MKSKSKIFIISLIILSVILLIFTFNKKKNNLVKIGLIQIIDHDSLDQSRGGFIDRLAKLGYIDKKNIEIDYQNAQGDISNCNLIANKLVKNSSLILAISTPAAQSVSNLTNEIPILVTAVTDPEKAGLVNKNSKPGKNVTGTSDFVSPEKYMNLIDKLFENKPKIGILYCSSEQNSKDQIDNTLKEAEKLNLQTEIFTVSQATDIQSVVSSMSNKKVEVIYVPNDNLIVSSMPLVYKTATSLNIPIISSEVNSVKNGALATYGIDYYELGKITADQAVEIIEKKNFPENMPIRYIENTKLFLNKNTIEKLNIKIPEELKSQAEVIQ
ncbi:MAG: ABC transporter substrate-binding protein [Candidatus Paraimprobicoccus trichonymphae]|uniref:ABC transporter substrate-binding protein n=1 Tax=Candidatus Paraimprobicoccus trichonymphae TaxID=3033793 RepID=A0AA48I5D0_9FIRM|nr:MAG: ABC transporter substrate-binding protein [Candidatus Paraimprobicoccus trichonymphae]